MKNRHIRKEENRRNKMLLAGKQVVNNFSEEKKSHSITKIKNLFGKEGIKILNSQPEHLDWFKIQDTKDMEELYDIEFSFRPRLGKNVEQKTDLDYTKKPFKERKIEDEHRYMFIHAPKELEEQAGKLEDMGEKKEIKYKLEWRELIKKAHNDFNEMFPPSKFTFAFFGSFLNFAKGMNGHGYNTLPGDLDADADISQFGQYLYQVRESIKNGGDIVDPQVTGTGKLYTKLRFYNKDNKEIDIFKEDLTKKELEDILKKTLEKKENQSFYGALRLSRKTKSKDTKLQLDNEIYFNMAGKGLTQISNNKDALTQVERDTIHIEIDGQRRRYLNERAQTRMYAMNLIYEADTNTADEYAKINEGKILDNRTFKGTKLASRIQKIGELNPALAAYKLIPLLLKVRLSFIMQAKKNDASSDARLNNFDEYIEKSLDPYLSGAVVTEKLQKSIGFDKKTEELFKKKNKEEIQKDKKELLLNEKDAHFMFIAVKYSDIAKMIVQAREERSISIAESAYTSLVKVMETQEHKLPINTRIDLLNWLLRKKLDLRDLQNIELVEKIQHMPSHANSIGDKLVKFYELIDKFSDKKHENTLADAEEALIQEGFNTSQKGTLIKFLERYMKEFGESYTELQDKIRKIYKKTQKMQNKKNKQNIKHKGELESLKEELLYMVKAVESECIEISDNLENLILFSLEEDSILSFALYSAGVDVRDAYIDPVREQLSRIKQYLQTGTLPSRAGSLRDLFPQDIFEESYRLTSKDKADTDQQENSGQEQESDQ